MLPRLSEFAIMQKMHIAFFIQLTFMKEVFLLCLDITD